MPDPAELDKKITIERVVITGNPGTGQTKTWEPVASNIWARILPQKASERMQAMKETSIVAYRVTIRDRAGIDATMRVNWNGRIMNIRDVPAARRLSGYLDLDCELDAAV